MLGIGGATRYIIDKQGAMGSRVVPFKHIPPLFEARRIHGACGYDRAGRADFDLDVTLDPCLAKSF